MQVEYSFDVEEAIMRLADAVADLVLVFLDPVRRRIKIQITSGPKKNAFEGILAV